MRTRLHRRTFLKGAGAVIALPFLEEMAPSKAWAQSTGPRRVITATLGGGLATEWQAGDYFGGTLAPLAEFRSKLGFYRGLEGRNNHGPANALLMTGADWVKDVPRAQTATIDYKLMRHFYPQGLPGPIPLLDIGVKMRNPDDLIGEARIWDEGPNPLGTPNYSPSLVFQAIFGRLPTQSEAEVEAEAAADASILDAVLEQYRHYAGDGAGLSMASRARLSDHMDEIRSLERAMGGLETQGCDAPELPGDLDLDHTGGFGGSPQDALRRFQIMADLFVLAFRCDLTRFGHALVFPLAGHALFRGVYRSPDGRRLDFDALRANVSDLNRHGDWHNTNHLLPRFSGADRDRALELAEAYRVVGVDMLQHLLRGLDAPQSVEANGRTILDNSVFFAASELGTNHDGSGVFHALGTAGGTFATDLVDVPDGATSRQFYDTVLDAFGAPRVDPEKAWGEAGTIPGVRR